MDADNHPDPFQDAAHDGLHRALQVGYAVAAGLQIYLHHRKTQAQMAAEGDETARRALNAQIRADTGAARTEWAPALDPRWLRDADLPQTARAWGAAMPYADRAVPWYEPAAAAAMRTCEQRLRVLHPDAMARYDWLRGEGMGSADAMRETAPLFARPARTYAPVTPRPALEAGNGAGPNGQAVDVLERRGRQIVQALQDQALAQGRGPFGEAAQRTVLEAITALPPEVIDRVVQPGTPTPQPQPQPSTAASATKDSTAVLGAAAGPTTVPVTGGQTRSSAAGRSAAADAPAAGATGMPRPWERDFPTPIRTVLAATTGQDTAAQRPAIAQATATRATAAQPPSRQVGPSATGRPA
jgi:hypothetical protein